MDRGTLAHALPWLELVPERVLVCAADGRIVWASSLAEFLCGRSRTALEGRLLDDLVECASPAGAPLLARLHARPRGEGIDGMLLHRTGTQIRIELASSGFIDELTIVVLRPTAGRDVVAPGDRTYELVFEGAPVGIFHFDAQGAITACNDAFSTILGSPRRVLVGVRINTLPDLVMRQCMLDTLQGAYTHYEGEYKSATSGRVRSVRCSYAPLFGEDGAVIGGVGIAEDVTERKAAELERRRADERFRALIERAPDAIAVHRDNRFLLVNPMLVRLLGYPDESALLARAVEDVLDPDHASAYRDLVAPPREPSTGVYRRELRLRGAHGEAVIADVASIPLDYDGGPAFLSFARDVTERRALEARLTVADRLASVGTLAAGIAHEINNPLAYVMLNLDIARRDPGLAPAIRTALDRAREGSERVRVIIRDLRIFSRIEEDRRVAIDVCDAIDSALNLARGELHARARIVRDTPPVPRVLGDEARLTQVILNLLVNAAQAIPESDPSQHAITVRTALRDGCVVVSVTDTGVGIPRDKLAHIFEPFWTTKPVGVGTGLGLSIVHGIVQALGGTIEVESELQTGSTFRVLLPPAPDEGAATVAVAPAVRDPAPPARARILFIDDERAFAEALRAGLQHRHEVAIETSGIAGLARLLRDDAFDLVVCDLMMPDVSGTAILEAVRETRPALLPRFALMTGGAFTEEMRLLSEQLGVRVLEKPFELLEIERLLAALPRP